MATMEASFPVNEENDRARKRIPFSAYVNIQDIADDKTVIVNIGDPNMIRVLSDEFSVAHRMSFRALKSGFLIRGGLEVAQTSISGSRVRFQTMLKGDELSV